MFVVVVWWAGVITLARLSVLSFADKTRKTTATRREYETETETEMEMEMEMESRL